MKSIYVLLISCLLINSCSIIDPAEPIPGYLHVQPFDFNVNAGQGTSSSKITEGWVYVAGDLLGAYTLPATLPVLATGTQEVQVFPGIHDNGIAALPDIYPMLERYTVSVNFAENQTDTIHPATRYSDNVQFVLLEGFENNLQVFAEDLDGNGATELKSSTMNVFEGNKSGHIYLTKDNAVASIGSSRINTFPPGGTGVYLEMNYKTDVPLGVGIIAYDNVGINILSIIDRGANTNEEWNKIYFNFTEEIRQISNGNTDNYQIVLQAAIPLENGAFTLDEANVYVDNVKLVMFE